MQNMINVEELTEPFCTIYASGEEVILGACDSSGAGGIGVIVNTIRGMNLFQRLTSRIGRLFLERIGSIAVNTLVIHAQISI